MRILENFLNHIHNLFISIANIVSFIIGLFVSLVTTLESVFQKIFAIRLIAVPILRLSLMLLINIQKLCTAKNISLVFHTITIILSAKILYPEQTEAVLNSVWGWIFVMMIAVTTHEWGHFIALRIFGIQVLKFSVGFGSELIGWTDKKTGTRWSISAIPMGGYVHFLSEKDPKCEITDANKHLTFESAKIWQRMIVLLGGVAMNAVTAYVVIAAQGYIYGTVQQVNTTITEIHESSPAERAGLQIDDKITHVNKDEVITFQDFQVALILNGANEALLTVERNGKSKDVKITPNVTETGRALIGVGITYDRKQTKLDFIDSLKHGADRTVYYTDLTLTSLGKLVTGNLKIEIMAGPVGIAKVSGDTYKNAGYIGLFSLLGIISISLAIMNSLPLLPLDGGHALMLIIEKIKGSPVPDWIQVIIQWLGIFALACLVLTINFFDVMKIIGTEATIAFYILIAIYAIYKFYNFWKTNDMTNKTMNFVRKIVKT